MPAEDDGAAAGPSGESMDDMMDGQRESRLEEMLSDILSSLQPGRTQAADDITGVGATTGEPADPVQDNVKLDKGKGPAKAYVVDSDLESAGMDADDAYSSGEGDSDDDDNGDDEDDQDSSELSLEGTAEQLGRVNTVVDSLLQQKRQRIGIVEQIRQRNGAAQSSDSENGDTSSSDPSSDSSSGPSAASGIAAASGSLHPVLVIASTLMTQKQLDRAIEKNAGKRVTKNLAAFQVYQKRVAELKKQNRSNSIRSEVDWHKQVSDAWKIVSDEVKAQYTLIAESAPKLGQAGRIENVEARRLLVKHRQSVLKKALRDLGENDVHFYYAQHSRVTAKRNRFLVTAGAAGNFSKKIRSMVGTLENFVESFLFDGETAGQKLMKNARKRAKVAVTSGSSGSNAGGTTADISDISTTNAAGPSTNSNSNSEKVSVGKARAQIKKFLHAAAVRATKGKRQKFTANLVSKGLLLVNNWPDSLPIKSPGELSAEEALKLYANLDQVSIEAPTVESSKPLGRRSGILADSTNNQNFVENASLAVRQSGASNENESEDELQPPKRRESTRLAHLKRLSNSS